jgi:hypothetical protein
MKTGTGRLFEDSRPAVPSGPCDDCKRITEGLAYTERQWIDLYGKIRRLLKVIFLCSDCQRKRLATSHLSR